MIHIGIMYYVYNILVLGTKYEGMRNENISL